jgi:hypothetical protein
MIQIYIVGERAKSGDAIAVAQKGATWSVAGKLCPH